MKYQYSLSWHFLSILCILGWLCINAREAHASPPISAEEEAKHLIVMITGQLAGEDRIGAGIIFGVDSDSLYIVTANHTVRQGKQESQNLQVRLRSLPDKPITAKLLSNFDSTLDIAVLSIPGIRELDIDVKAMPFDRVGDLSSLSRGDEVYSIGYGSRHAWSLNVTADKITDKTSDQIYFESNFISPGQSGGALLDKELATVGMIRIDQPPEGEAVSIAKILERLKEWNYPVYLGKPIETKFDSVASGNGYSCGITIKGDAYCFGLLNEYGQLGNGVISTTPSSDPYRMKRVLGRLTFKSISASSSDIMHLGAVMLVDRHTCGVTTDHKAYCWGTNSHGELGDGSTHDSNIPVPVKGGLTFELVSAGNFYTCGITTDRKAYCWGENGAGKLGDGSTYDSNIPVLVKGGLTFELVSAGLEYTCGVTTDHKAYCWGTNSDGELGDGSTHDSNIPVLVKGGLTFELVSAGPEHTCGVTTDHKAYCWGGDYSPENTITGERTIKPVPMKGGLTFESLSAGPEHTCGVTTDHKVYCWGNNSYGQLWDKSKISSSTPVPVKTNETFKSVSAGAVHTCGVTTTGIIICSNLDVSSSGGPSFR